MARATASAAGAVIASTPAGCSPVRAAIAPVGRTIWVTARADHKVRAFSAARLEDAPDYALLGETDSGGRSPVGMLLLDRGRLLAVANSNRFARPSAPGNLAPTDVSNPIRPRIIRVSPAGLFPRSISAGGDRELTSPIS